jgi:hypothetical protein
LIILFIHSYGLCRPYKTCCAKQSGRAVPLPPVFLLKNLSPIPYPVRTALAAFSKTFLLAGILLLHRRVSDDGASAPL